MRMKLIYFIVDIDSDKKITIFYPNHSPAAASAAVVVVVIGSLSSFFSFLIHLFFIQFSLRCQLRGMMWHCVSDEMAAN